VEGERSAYLTKDATQNLLLGSAKKITDRYYELASDLVHVVRKLPKRSPTAISINLYDKREISFLYSHIYTSCVLNLNTGKED
jgi:hypothetical protein